MSFLLHSGFILVQPVAHLLLPLFWVTPLFQLNVLPKHELGCKWNLFVVAYFCQKGGGTLIYSCIIGWTVKMFMHYRWTSGRCLWNYSCLSWTLSKQRLASFPGLPVFCSSVCVQYNTWKRKSAKNGEGLGTLITWMTSGGGEVDVGEVVQLYTSVGGIEIWKYMGLITQLVHQSIPWSCYIASL